MNSREKAEHIFNERYGGKEFFEEEIDMLTELLDQHAAEQRKRCGYKAAQYLSEDAEGFVSDLNAENAASEIMRVCMNAVEADNG